MKRSETNLSGVFRIEPESIADERGCFARTYCRESFASWGLEASFAQQSVSYNTAAHTLRGMHYQDPPHAEVKLVRCTRGRIYDVVLDLRPASPTWGEWSAHELDEEERVALYVPRGCAHGFLTLTPGAEVLYQISPPYVAGRGCGVRWNDAAFAIEWPAEPRVMSDRDRNYPDHGRIGS